MKTYKLALRIWIGMVSLFGFLGGWVLLAHSGKPVALFSTATESTTVVQPTTQVTVSPDSSTTVIVIPTLPPLPTVQNGSATTNNSQPVQIIVPSLSISNNAPVVNNVPQLISRGS
jgi:hypothetical protein